jgi:prepilin-type N-terminal cleavage/methylation domain-containing protein
MKPVTTRQKGFTLLEMVTVSAVVAVLAAVSVHVYGYYTDRARAVDIISKYDAIRSGSTSALRTQSTVVDDCAALAGTLGNANLVNAHAALTYGFQAVTDGYRPVLNVCAQAGTQGAAGVRVARETHDTLVKNGVVEPGPVLMDSVVSFSLRLTDGGRALCKTWTAPSASPCSNQTLPSGAGGSGPAQQPVPAASRPVVVQPPAQAASQPAAQGPGKPVVTVPGQSTPATTVRPPTAQPGGTGVVSNPGATVNPPRPATGGGPVDVIALQSWAMTQRAIKVLSQRDQQDVAGVVAMMAANDRYAQAVNAALRQAGGPSGPVNLPTSVQAHTTLPFTADMRRALEALYPLARSQACYMRNGPDARC